MMENIDIMANVRPITAIEGNIKQLENFYEDLTELDKHLPLEYETEFNELLDETDLLRSKFSTVYTKILTDHPELESEINTENTRIDGLRFNLNDILKEQKLIKEFGDNPEAWKKYKEEIWMLEESTMSLKRQYKLVRTIIRWNKGGMNE